MVIIMMAEPYLRRGKRKVRLLLEKPGVSMAVTAAAYGLSGFFLSAAGIRQTFQPIAMGIIAALSGWQAVAMMLGAMAGYRVFWGLSGIQGAVWAAAGGMLALLPGKLKKFKEEPLLLSLMAGAVTAALGLFYQAVYKVHTDLTTYFLRILLAAGSALLGNQLLYRRDPFTDWLGGGVITLCLSQLQPIPFVSLGCIAGACLTVRGSFPGAVLAGLGLDLSKITDMPMTAVLAAAYFLRLIPFGERWMRHLSPAAAYLCAMVLCGIRDPTPLPGLILGGGLAMLLPPEKCAAYRRGPTGAAQVRLELSAEVMTHMQRVFLEQGEPGIDEEALLQKAKLRACGRCPYKASCGKKNHLKTSMLHDPLSVTCHKTGRLVTELQRSQEQLRVMEHEGKRRQEFKTAMIQQYGFLSQYLRSLSDQLSRRGEKRRPSYCVQVSARSRRKEQANGDRCLSFPGVGCKYYVLLCDGMGTGLGAAEEGKNAGKLIKEMLKSGFPPEYVLENINSILVLRGQAGAVTVDLIELRLDTGRAVVYKWGAAPSYWIKAGKAEKIGTAGPPPGISMEEKKEEVKRLSLSRGEVLVLLSDGVDGEAAIKELSWTTDIGTGVLAEQLLQNGCRESDDDATVAAIRLRPASLSAS